MINFLRFLRKNYSEYANTPIRQGTVTDELSLKPTGLLMGDFYNLIVERQVTNDIDNWENMTEDQLDAFGNKFFFPRIAGSKAFVSVRIWTDNAVTIQIDEDFRAVSEDGLLYPAIAPRTITGNSMKVANDNFGNYYFDIMIQAEFEGTQYNKLAGQITALNDVDFEYTHVSNLKDVTPGAAHEVNSRYQWRLRYGINDRSLMNKRSLYAGLKKLFPFVYTVYVAGPGDKYMERDKLQAVDVSNPPKKAEFLGKIQEDNIVRHSAYYQMFPPAAGSRGALFNGPFSIYSDWDYPQTVEAVDLDNLDPAYHGYALYQEATNDMYRGLYYDDFRNFMVVQTEDLFNISEENETLSNKIIPNENWIVGANGKPNGDYGIRATSDLDKTDVVQFDANDIIIRGGIGLPITASKQIGKRTGIKLEGVFKVPGLDEGETSLNSSFQFMVGGANLVDENLKYIVDSFSGIGFGVRIFRDLISGLTVTDPKGANASVYFANNERYGSTYVYAQTEDITWGDTGALAEMRSRIRPGKEYNFEFAIFDDLSLGLKIEPREDVTGDNDEFNGGNSWLLPNTHLRAFENAIKSPTTESYGTTMKVTVDSESETNTDEWVVSNLRAVDLAGHRATALYIFNVDGLEEPLSVVFRGSGSGSVNGTSQAGHSVYIWNIEQIGDISGTTTLSSGGWERLESVSDPDGLKDAVTTSLSETISNIDKYKVSSRFGNVIILMAVTTGISETKLTINGQVLEDIQSVLTVDYIKIQDTQTDIYRGNNKADIYVDTIRNTDTFRTIEQTLTKSSNESYFVLSTDTGFEMPYVEIISVVDSDGNLLTESEYSIYRDNNYYINSVNDVVYLTAEGHDELTVAYSVYNSIDQIQDFFDGTEYGKVFGNILIKHKFPCYLDLELFYTGDAEEDEITNEIRNYVDDYFDRIFSVDDLINHLFTEGMASNVQRPLEITYEKTDDDLKTESGTFTDTLTIRSIDFFRLRNITVSRL